MFPITGGKNSQNSPTEFSLYKECISLGFTSDLRIFQEEVYGRYFLNDMNNIRFKDLSRGGLRTVFPQRYEQMITERNNVFLECYNLALTQQKKNKDIPEGGI